MAVTTISSREFNQDTAGAMNAAANGPVFITNRGRPTHVLLSIERYRELTAPAGSIVDLLAMPAELEFEPTPSGPLFNPAELG